MTVSNQINRIQYPGTGLAANLNTTFAFFTATDIEVVRRDTLTGVDDTLVLGTHYTVTGGGTPPVIGQVVVIDPAVTFMVTHVWTIQRKIPLTQLVDYVENDALPAESHEGQLDKNILVAQDIEQRVNQALRFPEGDSDSISRLIPSKELRAGRALTFDADGEPTASLLTVSDVTNAFVTATGSTASISLANRFGQIVNVKDFAATGDGTTHDNAALEAASNTAELETFGAPVFFPEGIYRVTGRVLDVNPLTGLVLLADSGEQLHLSAETSTVEYQSDIGSS